MNATNAATLIQESWQLVDPEDEVAETLRLLVLDDDNVDRQRLCRLAGELDFPVQIAEADSLDTLRTRLDLEAFDVVLIDFRLAAGDGFDALNVVSSHDRNKGAAKIMVAGDAQLAVAVSAMKRGCDDYLSKDSLDADFFRASVMEALSKAAGKTRAHGSLETRQIADAVLGKVSDESFAKMRPIMSRMLRQLRFLRQNATSLNAEQVSVLHDLEASCMTLGEFIRELADPQYFHSMETAVLH